MPMIKACSESRLCTCMLVWQIFQSVKTAFSVCDQAGGGGEVCAHLRALQAGAGARQNSHVRLLC
jgi:hypothetical protein